MEKFIGLSGTAWTGIYTIITVLLLAVAIRAACYAKKQWEEARKQVEEARKVRLEASRPYVIVSIDPSGVSQQLFDLTVKNIGHRPAMNVSIALDPAPKRARETDGHEIGNAKMLNEPIALIAPGQEMRAFYDNHLERAGRDDLPSWHQASVTYRDTSGHEYSESSVLDIDAMKGTLFTSVYTTHDIGKSLKEIQKIFAQASVLKRSGQIQAQASVESRSEQMRRITEENVRDQEQVNQLLRQVGFDEAARLPSILSDGQEEPDQNQAGEPGGEG